MLFRKNKTTKPSKIAMMDSKINEGFVEEQVSKINEDDVEIVMDNEEAISKKISNAPPLRKFIEIGKILFAMLRDVKNGNYPNVPWLTIATVVLVLLYVFNPLDIIPDFIPGIGYIDDLAVMSIGMGWIETDLHKYLDWRLKDGKSAS